MVSNSTEIVLGNIEKDSKYRKRIEDNTKEASHPRNQGIIMQAHHLISADAVKKSPISKLMKQYGYDINCIQNLVLLPYTLEGACHLEVQLHRGNHASPAVNSLIDSDDSAHPLSYHETIAMLLDRLALSGNHVCEGTDTKADDKFRNKLYELSVDILEEIEDFSLAYNLTTISDSFEKGKIGCAGIHNIPEFKVRKNKLLCPKNRNHRSNLERGSAKKNEIFFEKKAYNLKVGK